MSFSHYREWLEAVGDLLSDGDVRSMAALPQHRPGFSCYDHCLLVSYTSFALCRRLGWHSWESARGGLLHDFYLYDWTDRGTISNWRHLWGHPRAALRNAEGRFLLTPREKNIIVSHMFPLSLTPHRYREAWVVGLMDKLCALAELAGLAPRVADQAALPAPSAPALTPWPGV